MPLKTLCGISTSPMIFKHSIFNFSTHFGVFSKSLNSQQLHTFYRQLIDFFGNTFKSWNRDEIILKINGKFITIFRYELSGGVISGLNMRKKSNSRGWIFPTMTKEWSGWPNSQFNISFSVQTLIFWSGQPTRATPTHKVSPVNSAKEILRKIKRQNGYGITWRAVFGFDDLNQLFGSLLIAHKSWGFEDWSILHHIFNCLFFHLDIWKTRNNHNILKHY